MKICNNCNKELQSFIANNEITLIEHPNSLAADPGRWVGRNYDFCNWICLKSWINTSEEH